MGFARNASSGDKRSWLSLRSSTPKGAPVPGVHKRRWHRDPTGSNKAGLLKGNVPWESASGQKRYDGQHNVNNTARAQAIGEQTAEVYEDEWNPPVVLLPEPSRHEIGFDYDLEDLPPGVTFNGLSAADYVYSAEMDRPYLETEWDPYCWCTECNLGRDRDGLRGLLAASEAENIILRNENEVLTARVNFLEAKHGYA